MEADTTYASYTHNINSTNAPPDTTNEPPFSRLDNSPFDNSNLDDFHTTSTADGLPPGARPHLGPPLPPNLLGTANWVRDAEATNCHACSEEFALFTRKHHCRQCGRVFCYRCCHSKALLQPGSGTPVEARRKAHPMATSTGWSDETDEHKPQRVCTKCYEALLPLQPYIASTSSKAVMAPDFEPPRTLECYGKPISRSFRLEIKKATHALQSFLGQPDDDVVRRMIDSCHGVALLSIVKAGFLGTVQFGGGLVLARNSHTGVWSAPCAVGVAGLSIGAQVGAEHNSVMLVLRSEAAVRAFADASKVTLGLNLSVALGPVGRTVAGEGVVGETGAHAACYSYTYSRGAFAGVGLDGLVVFTRDRLNHNFYGHVASARQLLEGKVSPPRAAEPLYRALRTYVP